ncbi:hypothetical protein N0V90_004296 [Kalmusia sp. IMI 367209]|nr:hypothetical protein N0V90_004296 [Kalmusia sp. IMI 367209]
MASTSGYLAVAGLGLAVLYIALQLHLRATQDRSEPPAVENQIPYITPAIGLSKHTYFAYLRKWYAKLPIFTLRLPGQRIYVINDPQLISAVQRQYRILSFQAVEDGFSHKLLPLSLTSQELQKREADAWRTGPAHMPSPGHEQFKSLAPGKHLDQMNQIMLKSLEETMEGWPRENSQTDAVKLFEWIKEVIIIPTTEGVYGPANPYRDSSVRKNYWTFFNGVPKLVKGLKWFAKDSVVACDSLGRTFEKYYEQGGHQRSFGLTRNSLKYYSERGFPLLDIAYLTAGTGIAVLGNTLPAAFWFVLHLYSDRKVFDTCREEVLAQVVHGNDGDGNALRTVDITALKAACPLLHSAFREVLRLEAIGTGVRGVAEDHLLDGKYLLKKDALIFMPLVSQHFDHERWGADAEEYCYDRFTDKTRPRVNNVSFRSFGGGTTLCPGRHFVTTELLAFAAMLLLRFEIIPKDGKWIIPTSLNAEMTTNVPAPDFDIDVEIRRRADDEGVKWAWKLSESEHAVMLGDQDEHGNEKN